MRNRQPCCETKRQKTGNKAEFDKACLVMSGAVRVVVLGSRVVYWTQGCARADHLATAKVKVKKGKIPGGNEGNDYG